MSYEKRWKVALRQHWCCNHCKMGLPETAEMDHCRPLHAGGSNAIDNLQLLCPNCHALKTRRDRRAFKS
ncbi:HNH endonuclease [Nereida ignava]|uniref:HNH endonuclease n=1 Tax=Nereida ignava TaxID=282199 RepID=UPI003C6E7A44